MPAVVTGKPIPLGGSYGRETATADGAFFVLSTLLPKLAAAGRAKAKEDAPTVAIQGFGNAGAQLAELLAGDGYRVVAAADSPTRSTTPTGSTSRTCGRPRRRPGRCPRTRARPSTPTSSSSSTSTSWCPPRSRT